MKQNATKVAAYSLGTVALVAAAGTLTHAALSASSQLFGPTLIAGPNPDHLALTFDDGPNPAATPQLLDMLAAAEVRATFFLIGNYVRREPVLARRIATAGHLVGNHTMTHPWLAWQSAARVREEIAGCNALLEDTLGAPIRFFRPPHGARRPFVLSLARDLGLTTVQWNVMPKDWQLPLTPETIVARVGRGIVRNQRHGRASNLLLHDGDGAHTNLPPNANRQPTLEAVRQLLTLYPRASFVTPGLWLPANIGGPAQ